MGDASTEVVYAVWTMIGLGDNSRRESGVERKEHTSLAGNVEYTVLEERYPITLDAEVTLEGLLKAGNYDMHIGDPSEARQMFNADTSIHDAVLKLIGFECSCAVEHICEVMEKGGYRPATLRELLALGAQYPDLQRQRILVALGSLNQAIYIEQEGPEWSLGSVLHLPVLTHVLGERTFLLGEYDGKYRPGYYFVCVKR
jgi:hypothetical protein